jgi:ferredoxin
MKLTVDSDICQGYGLCHDEAPELVELDDAGYALVLGDGTVSPELELPAEKAAGMCPAKALRLT